MGILRRMRQLLIISLLSLCESAPQYGGGSSQPARQPAPVQNSPQVACRTEYAEVWDTEYVETETQDCQTVQVKQCNTAYKKHCEYQWEGTGNNKVWVPIQGTCQNNAYDKCGDVQKERLKQVPYNDCKDVPKQVPSQECRTVTEQACSQVPYENCQDVPKQECRAVHKKVPKRVSRRVPKKVCDDGGSYGAINRQTEAVGSGGVKIRSDAPEKQVKLKSGDAVNFGR